MIRREPRPPRRRVPLLAPITPEEAAAAEINGAGIILYTMWKGTPYFLLLQNKWGRRYWGFAKGHIDLADGGNHLRAALREVEEETKFTQEMITLRGDGGPVGRAMYRLDRPTRRIPTGIKHIEFFLGEVSKTDDPDKPFRFPELSSEHVAFVWQPYMVAVNSLPLEMRGLLRDVYTNMLRARRN
nr:NUDIX hydrolase [Sicyoidochytrium minutum DNA virus]